MNKATLTTVLEDAGLSPYQAEAYVTVVELGSASATDIADESDVPDPRIYDVLRDLEKQGYVETYEQDSLHARAHSPDSVLADLRNRATEFEAAADEIEQRWEAPAMDHHTVSFVKRLETVLDRAEAMIGEASHQVEIAANLEQFERLRPALEAAREAGVHTRIALYVDEAAGESWPSKSELASVASEAHFRSFPMPFVALVDRKGTCFAPLSLSSNRYGIIVEDRTHAYVFHWYFMSGIWQPSESVLAESESSLPWEYVNIRNCIRNVRPLLESGATVSAIIEATDMESGVERTLEGEIVDITYPEFASTDDQRPFLYIGGKATLYLDTGDGIEEVGGWGAIIEDYEATRIVIEDVRPRSAVE